MLLKLLTFFILRKARNFQSLGRGQAFLSLRLGFVVPRHNFRPSGRLELFLALRPGFFVLRECKKFVLRGGNFFGTSTFATLGLSAKKISTPQDKFFYSPSGQKSLVSVPKIIPVAPQDENYAWGQQSPTFGKKPVPSLGIEKFLAFLQMKKVKSFRSIKKPGSHDKKHQKINSGCLFF